MICVGVYFSGRHRAIISCLIQLYSFPIHFNMKEAQNKYYLLDSAVLGFIHFTLYII